MFDNLRDYRDGQGAVRIERLFEDDSGRAAAFSVRADGLLFDYSKTTIDASARDQLLSLAERAGLAPGHWDPCIVEGEASLRLVEQEQVLDCDLVVIGKHGQSAAEDLLLGSVTKHVLAESQGDVLVSALSWFKLGSIS